MQFYITFLDAETSLILPQITGSETSFSHFYPLNREKTHIKYSDNLGGRIIMSAPQKEWKDSCSFDVDDTENEE